MNAPFPVPDAGGPASFFGFMGVSMALVLASISPVNRLRSCLWNCKSRNWHQQYLHLETRSCHEIAHSSRHGRYFGYLWNDCGRHHQSERYLLTNLVKPNADYLMKNGYSHMASGLVCGFSCIVLI